MNSEAKFRELLEQARTQLATIMSNDDNAVAVRVSAAKALAESCLASLRLGDGNGAPAAQMSPEQVRELLIEQGWTPPS
jgi:ribosomal protein L16/L10AE